VFSTQVGVFSPTHQPYVVQNFFESSVYAIKLLTACLFTSDSRSDCVSTTLLLTSTYVPPKQINQFYH
jgi:hypothetical protein